MGARERRHAQGDAALTDASLLQPVLPGGRTLGRIAWHIVLSIGEMAGRAGLAVHGPSDDTPTPAQAGAVVSGYEIAARSLGEAVRRQWSDAALGEMVEMYGDKWTKGFVLSALIAHEIHHRGQMTVLMRQAGLKVPGVYGPAREEWGALGMTPQE